MNFHVILHGPYHVGDDDGFFDDSVEDYYRPPEFPRNSDRVMNADFPLPGFSPGGSHALLMFQSKNVNAERNSLTINGTPLHLRPGVASWEDRNSWTTQIIAVEAEILRAENNTLRVAANDPAGGTTKDLDDFAIAEVVMLYQSSDEVPGVDQSPILQAEQFDTRPVVKAGRAELRSQP